ncbi:MAG: hypothetical protein R3B45_17235 [Bdellovibrionota bacterium]
MFKKKCLNLYILAIAISSSLIGIQGCGKKNAFKSVEKNASQDSEKKNGSNEIILEEKNSIDDNINKESNSTEQSIADNNVDVGLKNFLQINATFSILTDVKLDNQNIIDTFDDVKLQLPTDNDIKSFSPSIQVAISKLATQYCYTLISDVSLRTKIIPGFDFTANVSDAFSSTSQDIIINALFKKFWIDEKGGPDQKTAKATLLTLLSELKKGEESGGATKTAAIATGLCTAVLASSATTFL